MNTQYSFGTSSTKDTSEVRSEAGPSTSFEMDGYLKQCETEEKTFDMDKFMAHRQELIEIEKRMHFSYDLEAGLTDEERQADAILDRLRRQELKDDSKYNVIIHDYFENFVGAS